MKYHIKCLQCGKTFSENRYITKCINGCDSVLRTEYEKKQLDIIEKNQGILKYINWLPFNNICKQLSENCSSFSMYMSSKLADYYGLEHLLICCNTYQPGSNESMRTGTFKDIEAEMSFQRIIETKENGKPFVLSSDGNVATSFIHYSNIFQYPIVLSVTEDARLNRIWSFRKSNPYITFISMLGNCDYYNSIALANELGENIQFVSEGGALNIARRDGIGTIMLEATRLLGHLPDHYFQSLGSGPGAIAVYEASLRLKEDGRFGKTLPKIHGSQNHPFVPMYEAWQRRSRIIDSKYQNEKAIELTKQVYAHVLTNRHPAYSIKGGVFDALKNTSGEFYSITNEEAIKAQKLFKKLEGYDIEPPVGITVASLIKSIESGTVNKDDYILLNIAGGGRENMKKEKYILNPTITVNKKYNINNILRMIK
ncbi:MAG: cysteate synthase [Armatimonadetes bacterium]|nr:cysteate synthase [Armatimonadota bacterium]